ncbi:P-loop containing nucleoside triphosphate hydrolase protein [Fomes fomentarius]|nr:P-loop containing nucleoside triphosphate hydrolase protein [Fomes fomentarius]
MNFTPLSSANSSPSPPDRSQRPRKWNLSSQTSRNVYCGQSMTPYLEPGASYAIAAERFDDDTWLDGHNTGRESHLLADIYRSLFKFGVFNAVQSQCFDTVMHSDENMVPPTGSGKTVLFELAIVKMLRASSGTGRKAKCVYIAPTKVSRSELTGDTVNIGRGAWGDAKDATIILTRNWQDHSHVLSQITLFLIDEVHLLNETRGSTLEVVVSRMKLRGASVRFVVVSATVPNIQDVAEWVGNQTGNGPATIKEFGEEFRPCRLSKFVYGIPRRKDTNDFVFAKALDYKLYGVLRQHCNNKPVLVFCPTRKGVMVAAEQIFKEYEEAMGKRESLPWSKPPRIEHVFSNKQLDKLAACGIGVHHAGLQRDDRSATENLYLKKVLKVLLATSTLAVGVNLPAHTVVIKGVKLYQNNASQEYSDLDVMQMIGRAGRPQFDKEGVAVIMCEQELEAKYKALTQGQSVLESSLHRSLPEHLNSEIALGTITNMDNARKWLHSSFLYQRIQKNPAHYDMRREGNKTWEESIDELVTHSVSTLKSAEMVNHDAEDDQLSSTDYGDIMSKMVQIMNLSDKATVREIVYNKLRTHHDIRYTIKKIEKPSDKVFLLIQAILGAINLSDPEYKSAETQPYSESIPIVRHIPRIARAVVEIATMRKAGGLLKGALEVMRCLSAKAWEDRSVLAEHNVTTFAALRNMDPGRIEQLLNRKSPFGYEVLAAVNQLPQFTLDVIEDGVSTGKNGVEVELSIVCGLVREVKACGSKKNKKHKRHDMAMVLTLTSDNNFIDFRRISTSALKDPKSFGVTATLTKPSQSINVYITSARDLEGLEDVVDFWDVDVGEDGTFKTDEEPQTRDSKGGASSDKTKCRHLCCRDGLAKPPPMTKKRLEQIVAAVESSGNSQAWPQKIALESTSSTKSKPKPKLKVKESSTPKGKTMQQLEALHKRTGVKENLQLGDGSRIKLEHDLRGTAKRVMPIFDLEFASLNNEPSKPTLDDSALPSESDDDMPDACDILGTLGSSEGEKPIAASDSTDYADPEFDALIANEERRKAPLFDLSLSDEGADGGSSRLFYTQFRSSPTTSPAPVTMDNNEGFVLDNTLFDILPSTPTVTEEASISHSTISHSSQALANDANRPWSLRRPVEHRQDSSGSLGHQARTEDLLARRSVREQFPFPNAEQDTSAYDDPLAEFEAWLKSGAVDIVEE